MDDDEILARLDTDPDAFAVLYRRHLDDVLARAPDPGACAEAFAAVLDRADRYDPARGSVAAWLQAVAGGRPRDRARRRLGIAALPPGPGFAEALEEELVEAARFRAGRRRRRRPAVPRVQLRWALAALLAAVALAAAVLALGGGDDPPVRVVATAPPGGFALALPGMQGPTPCGRPQRARIAAKGGFAAFALLRRPQRLRDPLQRMRASFLPIRDYDPQAVRRPSGVRLTSVVRVVPTTAVVRGRCGGDGGLGLCLVVDERALRCFTTTEARAGRGLARTPRGTVVGIVPDGIERVTVAGAPTAVVENVYEAQPGREVGDRVEVRFTRTGASGCERTVAPALTARVAALRAPPGGRVPAAARGILQQYDWPADAIVAGGARRWGEDRGVSFWVVPVAADAPGRCAPADRACVVAVTAAADADAQCSLFGTVDEQWRLVPLGPRRTALYGTVPDEVTGARVTFGDLVLRVPARANVLAGVLPFPLLFNRQPRVKLLREARPAG